MTAATYPTPNENYIGMSKFSTNEERSKTAKLSQKIMFQLANGSIKVSKSALQLMLYSINFVAKDGRIYRTFEQIKRDLNFQTKTLVRVIVELEGLGFLSKRGDFFYSHFHVLSEGEKTDETYVRNLKAFTSPTVLNLKKNELRFFLYIASRGLINQAVKRSTVETLYSNSTHKGVNYIDSYHSLADILNVLISFDLIEVHVENQIFKKANAEEFLCTFHAFCGYQENNRKKRMSKKVEKTHVIGFRINPTLWVDKNIRENEAARREIEYFADQNCFFHSHMRPKTIPTFIKNVQNVLFNRFGLVGYELYRESLINYFEKEGDNVIYHDLYANENSSKAINTMVDFFLLPSISKLIAAAASSTPSEDSKVNYFKKKENLVALVDYFNDKASDNHLILLDEALEEVNVVLSDLVNTVQTLNPTENSWFRFQAQTNHLYKTIEYNDSVLSLDFQKRIIRQWAKKGLFTQKQLLDTAVKTLKEKVVFLPKEVYKQAMNNSVNTNKTKSSNPKTGSSNEHTSTVKTKKELLEEYKTNPNLDYKF